MPTMLRFASIAWLTGVAFCLAASARADDVILYLVVNGVDIEGENTTAGREGSIVVFSVGSSVVVPSGGPSPAQHKPFTITKPIDKSTPLILKALVQGEIVSSAEFRFYRPTPGGDQHYYTVLLENGRVTSASAVSDVAGVPVEMVGFEYQRITWTYEPTGATHTHDLGGTP